MKNVVISFLAVLTLVGLWLSSLLLLPIIARDIAIRFGLDAQDSVNSFASFGQVGDMFGAVNALFSALALGAVALTLWVDVRSRSRARRPLVVSKIRGGNFVALKRPQNKSQKEILPLEIALTLSNQTADAALNVSVECYLNGATEPTKSVVLEGPLIVDTNSDVAISAELGRDVWLPLLDRLTAQQDVRIKIIARYENLEEMKWLTEVTYVVKWTDDTTERAMMNSVRSGSWPQDWGVDATVLLAATAEAGSWKHTQKR